MIPPKMVVILQTHPNRVLAMCSSNLNQRIQLSCVFLPWRKIPLPMRLVPRRLRWCWIPEGVRDKSQACLSGKSRIIVKPQHSTLWSKTTHYPVDSRPTPTSVPRNLSNPRDPQSGQDTFSWSDWCCWWCTFRLLAHFGCLTEPSLCPRAHWKASYTVVGSRIVKDKRKASLSIYGLTGVYIPPPALRCRNSLRAPRPLQQHWIRSQTHVSIPLVESYLCLHITRPVAVW